MSDKLGTILRYALYGLMGISVVIFILFYFGPSVVPAEYDIEIPNIDAETNIPVYTSLSLTWSYVLFGIALIAAVIFPIVSFNFKKSKNSLIGIGVIIVIALISYALAGTDPVVLQDEEIEITDALLKNVGTGINLMFALIGLAFLSIIYVEVAKLFK